MDKKSLRGFTLAELLIVVVIIGVLASIALPSYRLATEKAKVAAVLPVLRSIREAQQAYYMDRRIPACDLSKLNIKVDYTVEETRTVDRKDENGNVICDGPVNAQTGECSNPRTVDMVCGVGYNAQGLPSHNGNEESSLFDYDTPEYQGEPRWNGRNGITLDEIGYVKVYKLASKDTIIPNAHQVYFGSHTNNLNIDYHLLGTTGEVAGQWSYLGCYREAGGTIRNRCDGLCYGRGLWDKVCKSLANGKFAGSTNGQNPNNISEENAAKVGGNFPDSTLWCLGGTSRQYKCPTWAPHSIDELN